jgi:hypothetical protein
MKRRRKPQTVHRARHREVRAQRYRAWNAEAAAPTCPTCRKGAWPTRSAARAKMREVISRPDHRPPPAGVEINAYVCPDGHGWHWGYRIVSRDEDAS